MPRTGRPPVQKITVTCAGCPTQLQRYPREVEQSTTGLFFCSSPCRNRVGSKPRRKAMSTCELVTCGATFYPRSGGINRYCSRDCKDLASRLGADRICEHCGETFHARPSEPDIYCNRVCYETARATPIGATKPTPEGYVLAWHPGHSEAQATGWAFQHRVVMADYLGHPLPDGSTVHHRNGRRDDNRPSNLELRATAHGPGATVPDLLDWARELLMTYGRDEARLRELAATPV